MRRKSSPQRILNSAAISLSAALVLTSCSGDGADTDTDNAEDHLIPQEDIDRLNTTLVEANDLAVELDHVSSRLTRQCMEDLGFTLHPEPLQQDPEHMIQALPGTEVPHQEMIPDADEAASVGAEVYEDWIYTMSDDYVNTEIPNDPEWLALGREGHDEYFEALHDMERVDMSELADDELREHLEDDSTPEFGGCRGLAVEQIYGEDVPVLDEVEPDDVGLNALPPLPGDINLDPWEVDFHTPELLEAKEEWSSCLEERGNPSVTRVSGLSQYIRSFYETSTPPEINWYSAERSSEDYIEPPEDAPFEFEEAKENEIAFVTDLAECADETEFREARQQAWDQTLADQVIDYEDDMYLWQDQVEAALTSAQEALAE